MTLTRWQRPNWDPARQLSTLREEIDRLFESPLTLHLPKAERVKPRKITVT